jgi:hypothetical protein
MRPIAQKKTLRQLDEMTFGAVTVTSDHAVLSAARFCGASRPRSFGN